jgi:hypothetical protein
LNILGDRPGMWFVHPPQRRPGLAEELPQLIARIERGDVPVGQHGDDQVNVSMVPATAPTAARP